MHQKNHHYLFLAIVAALFSLLSPYANALDVKVILLGGQSNSVGQARSTGLPTSPNNLQQPQTDVLFFYDGNPLLTTLQPGSGGNPPPAASFFGLEISFGRAIADASPAVVYAVIKHGENGTALYNDWNPTTGASYSRFRDTVADGLTALQTAGHTTEIIGMLWHQGESDAIEGRQANYATNLPAFIADIRTRYGANLPFLIGEIRRSNEPAFVTVADAQVAVAAADANAQFVPASDLTFSDTHHFDAPGLVTLGERFAVAYAALKGGAEDTTPPTASTLSPTNDASAITLSTDLAITFDENITIGTGNITIKDLDSSSQTTIPVGDAQISVSGAILTINPDVNLAPGTNYAILIDATAIDDTSGNSFSGISNNTTWSFTTAPHSTIIVPTSATTDSTLGAGNRDIAYIIEGQGFNEGTQLHNTFAEGNSWTSNTKALTSNLDIVFDLGDQYSLTDVFIWNWNDLSTINAGVKSLEVLVASSLGGPKTSVGILTLSKGTGSNNYAGESFTINAMDVREVTLSIIDGHGFTNNGGELVGLSEVRLGGVPTVVNEDFASYISNPSFGLDLADQDIGDDPDGDQLSNGLEAWFGTDPGKFNTGLTIISSTGNILTFTHPQNANPPEDLTGYYEWSPNLVDWYAGDGSEGPIGGLTVTTCVSKILEPLIFKGF